MANSISPNVSTSRFAFAIWLLSSSFLFSPGTVLADIILAHSVNDWLSAVNDGIGVGGSSVVAGSNEDAAQQGHSDTEGSGIWNYKNVDNPAGGTFSSDPGFFTNWNQGAWRTGNAARMSNVGMAPTSTLTGGTLAAREWFGSGLAGETLRVFGEFTTKFNSIPHSATNNGVRLMVLLNQQVLLNEQMAPGGTVSFNFNVTSIHDAPRIRFLVGPDGPILGANGVNDFFNDGTQFRGQIHQVTVPAPGAAALFLLGLTGLMGHQRARRIRQD